MAETINFNDGTLKINISMDDNKITKFDLIGSNEFNSQITYDEYGVNYSDNFIKPKKEEVGAGAAEGGNNKKTRRRRRVNNKKHTKKQIKKQKK
jgi:hypothetical protein